MMAVLTLRIWYRQKQPFSLFDPYKIMCVKQIKNFKNCKLSIFEIFKQFNILEFSSAFNEAVNFKTHQKHCGRGKCTVPFGTLSYTHMCTGTMPIIIHAHGVCNNNTHAHVHT